jgi:hypothetical protein
MYSQMYVGYGASRCIEAPQHLALAKALIASHQPAAVLTTISWRPGLREQAGEDATMENPLATLFLCNQNNSTSTAGARAVRTQIYM